MNKSKPAGSRPKVLCPGPDGPFLTACYAEATRSLFDPTLPRSLPSCYMRRDTLLDTPRISLRLVHGRTRLRTVLALASLLALTAVFYVRPAMLRGASSLSPASVRARSAVRHQSYLARMVSARGSGLALSGQSAELSVDSDAARASAARSFSNLRGRCLHGRRALCGLHMAGAGFFASRVMAGHLPLLEAYPALPQLLWLVDRAVKRSRFALAR